MKVFVVVALLVTLISYSSSEGIDDLDADDFLSLMANEQPRKDCIPKHHECTSDKHGCCRGHMFKSNASAQQLLTRAENRPKDASVEQPLTTRQSNG
uniref:U21-Lycotoxin-Lsp1cp_1 n=1 Tax=Lycosa sp. SGP-2016 TaxID=1905177 RepID=A0A482ZE79_9ARAC